MLAQLKRKRTYFIILLLPYIAMMFLLTYRIDYVLSAPGGLSEVENQVDFETMYDTENSFYTTYVMSIAEPTFFQFMISYFDDGVDSRAITVFESGQTDAQRIAYGHLQRDNAWNAAIISSYTELDIHVEFDIRMLVTRIYLDYADVGGLDVLDEVIEINGQTNNFNTIINQMPCSDSDEDVLVMTVRNLDGDVREVEVRKTLVDGICRSGFTLDTYYDITEVGLDYTVSQSFIGGPSGGLMQFLHIYNVLTEDDLTSGLKIAGTGGISLDGSVRSMGSIKQKILGAHHAGVDVFFVPHLSDSYHDNYQIALRTLETLDSDMEVVGVSHWTEAVNYLIIRKEDAS